MAHALSPLATQMVQAVGWALLHSLWQGALIWLLLRVLFRTLPWMTARLKYGCALTALGMLVLWVVNTAAAQWQQAQTTMVHIIPGGVSNTSTRIAEVPADISRGYVSFPLMHHWMPWLVLCYAIGLFAMLFRLSVGVMQLHKLRTHDLTIPGEPLQRVLNTLKLQMDVTQKVLLRISTRVVIPVVIGALRPMILLPASMVEELSPEALEVILMHELAHIGRSDYIVNVIQSVVETLFFFNPFVWRISASIRREREHCCDDLVVAYTQQPITYARALASLAGRQSASVSSIALAATGQHRQPLLLQRIKRIIEMKAHPFRSAHVIAACCLTATIIAVSIACFSPSWAQHSSKYKDNKPVKQQRFTDSSATSEYVVIDSDKVKHVYHSMDEMPERDRKSVQNAMKEVRKATEELKALNPTLQEHLAGLGDSIRRVVHQSLSSVNWNEVSKEVEHATAEIAAVDWNEINREIGQGMAEARDALNDPEIRAEIHREMAKARREIERGKREWDRVDRRRMMADARREAEQAKRDAAQMRRDMEEMREELQHEREEMKRWKEKQKEQD